MTIYRPKTIIPGFKLGIQFNKLEVVAIPKQELKDLPLMIEHNQQSMVITELDKPLTELEFEDKFGRGKYTLVYYSWNPNEQMRAL